MADAEAKGIVAYSVTGMVVSRCCASSISFLRAEEEEQQVVSISNEGNYNEACIIRGGMVGCDHRPVIG